MTEIICSECKAEFDQSDKINLDYEGSRDFDFCTIDCVLRHVMIEVLADDRPIKDILRILTYAEQIHNENI